MLMTRCPCVPSVHDMYLPASPLPMMIASYCSGVLDIRNLLRLILRRPVSGVGCGRGATGFHQSTACQALTCTGTFPGSSAYCNFYRFETIPLVWPGGSSMDAL